MKKILFILFTVQFILIPRITGSYGANSIGNNHGHSVTNQGKKTIKKDIFGDTVIEDNHGNRKTIKKDIFGDTVIEDNRAVFSGFVWRPSDRTTLRAALSEAAPAILQNYPESAAI